MKKMRGALLVFVLASLSVQAQKHERFAFRKEQKEFSGYTIRLLPAMANTYGYDIVKGNQILLHQNRNPFTGSVMGLTQKEDVYKVAQWQIENIKQLPVANRPQQAPKLPAAFKQKFARVQQPKPIIPAVNRKVADQLHINLGNH